MIPAVFNRRWLNSVPGIFCDQHGFTDINFEDIFLSNRIKFQGPLTEQGAIVGFETTNIPASSGWTKEVMFGAKNSNRMLVGV